MPQRSRTIACGLAAFALMLSVAGDAAAAPPKSGVYAVSTGCDYWGVGKSKKAATAACDKKVGRDRMPKSCRCSRGAVFATFTKAPEVAFYLAGPSVGRTTESARAACVKLYRTRSTADINVCDEVSAAYGPFAFGQPIDDNPFVYLTDGGYFVDKNGNSPCFPAGTMIATPTGDRPIEDLQPGDAVLSWSVEEGRAVVAHVSRTKVRDADLLLAIALADGRTLRVTPNHPLWRPAQQAWALAGEVVVGDRLAVRDDQGGLTSVAVVAVGPDSEPSAAGKVQVYDLTVLPTHAYFAGGILAHNY